MGACAVRSNRVVGLVVVMAAFCAGIGCGSSRARSRPGSPPPGPPPKTPVRQHVLLIIADDLGLDRVTAYEDDYPTYFANNLAYVPSTPTISKLAEAGVRFSAAWSMPVCSPTRATVYTGRYPFRTGVGYVVTANGDVYLAPDETTVAGALAAVPVPSGSSAYLSALFGKWHLGAKGNGTLTDNKLPLTLGWETHRGTMSGSLPSYYNYEEFLDGDSQGMVTTYATVHQADEAIAWIAAQKGRWMVTVAFNAPHTAGTGAGDKYEKPPTSCQYGTAVVNKEDRFMRMVECLDVQIARLLSSIDPDTLAQTTIIFMSDNGTDTANAGSHGAFAADHGKSTLYEGGIHVPLIIADGYAYVNGACRKVISQDGQIVGCHRTVDDLVSVADVYATALGIAGRDNTTGTDSRSLVPYLESTNAAAQRTSVYSETFGDGVKRPGAVIRDATYKLHVYGYERPDDACTSAFVYPSNCCSTGSTDCEFYKVVDDKFEKTNLLTGTLTTAEQDTCDALLAEMKGLHQSWVDEACPRAGVKRVDWPAYANPPYIYKGCPDPGPEPWRAVKSIVAEPGVTAIEVRLRSTVPLRVEVTAAPRNGRVAATARGFTFVPSTTAATRERVRLRITSGACKYDATAELVTGR